MVGVLDDSHLAAAHVAQALALDVRQAGKPPGSPGGAPAEPLAELREIAPRIPYQVAVCDGQHGSGQTVGILQEAVVALEWSYRNLASGGQLLIEARSVEGSLYGKGEPAGRDAYIHDGHYRRFLRSDELVALGFVKRECSEASGLAVRGDDDPVLIRAVAEKP